MSEYLVSVKETLERMISIESNSESEAITKVKSMYHDEEIVLSDTDFVTVDIEVDHEVIKSSDDRFSYFDFEKGVEYLRDMKENQFYGIDITSNCYANIMLLRKEKDTLWVVSLQAKELNLEDDTLLSNYEIADNSHSLLRFNDFKFLSNGLFPEVYIELYNAWNSRRMGDSEPVLYEIETDLKLDQLNIKLLHDLYKKSEEIKKIENLSK